MPLVPVAPPVIIRSPGAFGYVAVDAPRRRVYAAHPGGHSLVVLDPDGHALPFEIPVGSARGVAFDAIGGHVFVGTTEGMVVEIDPLSRTVLRSVDAGGPVGAIAYDATLGRIYATVENGAKLRVIDARTMTLLATVELPGRSPESLVVDPITHDVYQNLADTAEVDVIDPKSDTVRLRIPTPELVSNHPVQFDAAYGEIVTAGTNGVLSVYDRGGIKRGQIDVPAGIDQCDLDGPSHVLACAHDGSITRVQLARYGPPALIDTTAIAPAVHSLAFDAKTQAIWTVWPSPAHRGSFGGAFHPAEAQPAATASPH